MADSTSTDPFDVFINAWGFHSAATVLSGRPEKNVFVWAIWVNESLSIELYLKCLHLVRGRNSRKYNHDLCRMFDELDEADRLELRREYGKMLSRYSLTSRLTEEGFLVDIESVLSRTNGVFESVRYWHEFKELPRDSKGRASDAGVVVLANALNEYLLKLQPTWAAKFEEFTSNGHPRFPYSFIPVSKSK